MGVEAVMRVIMIMTMTVMLCLLMGHDFDDTFGYNPFSFLSFFGLFIMNCIVVMANKRFCNVQLQGTEIIRICIPIPEAAILEGMLYLLIFPGSGELNKSNKSA